MEENSPLVSVIVPSYNHAKFVSKCIHSIIDQTYKNIELIVIDDGSSDDSRDILSILKEQYEFTLVFQKNMGLPQTLNKGIQKYSNGKYIGVCASDDYWMPDKLERQVTFMEQNPDIPMCYGKAYIVDEENNILKIRTSMRNKNLKGGYIFKDILLLNFHPPVNYLFRKSIFDEVGYFRETILTEDYYMNLKLSKKYQIGYIDEYLFYRRILKNPHYKLATINSSLSHLECINEYMDSEYYHEAITKWNFRNFIWYSGYRRHKLYAIKGMLYSIRYFFTLRYLRSIIRLLLLWR